MEFDSCFVSIVAKFWSFLSMSVVGNVVSFCLVSVIVNVVFWSMQPKQTSISDPADQWSDSVWMNIEPTDLVHQKKKSQNQFRIVSSKCHQNKVSPKKVVCHPEKNKSENCHRVEKFVLARFLLYVPERNIEIQCWIFILARLSI